MKNPQKMTIDELKEAVRQPESASSRNLHEAAKAELEFRQDTAIEELKLKNLKEQDDLLKEFQDLIETQSNVIFLVSKGLGKFLNFSRKRNRWIALTIFLLAAMIIPIIVGTGVNVLTALIALKFPWLPLKP